MENCYNEYGNIDFCAPAHVAALYNELARRIVEIRQYGPGSRMNGGEDTPPETRWGRYQERQREEQQRQKELYRWALETGQWAYRPMDPDEYEIRFQPGGRKAKGYSIFW